MSSIPTPILHRFPREILDHVALHLVLSTPSPHTLSPLLSLLLTSSQLYLTLRSQNPSSAALYARLFPILFDAPASLRRLGSQAHFSSVLSKQLRLNLQALLLLSREDPITAKEEELEKCFATCLVLLTEHDRLNRTRLAKVGLDGFVERYVRERLGSQHAQSWPPKETRLDTLALWVFWLTTTQERLSSETPAERRQIIRLVLPYVSLPFRYPTFHAPDIYYTLPPLLPTPSQTQSLVPPSPTYPPSPSPTSSSLLPFTQHHSTPITASTPLITQAAILIYFARMEQVPIGVPRGLPRDREEAVGRGIVVGVTQEDVREVNECKVVRLPFKPNPSSNQTEDEDEEVDPAIWTRTLHLDPRFPSAKWDPDWARWKEVGAAFRAGAKLGGGFRTCRYVPGTFTGLWHGRMAIPSDQAYTTLLSSPARPAWFANYDSWMSHRQVYLTLREHHCVSPAGLVHVSAVGEDEGEGEGGEEGRWGVGNAWFPRGVRVREGKDGVTFSDRYGMSETTYERHVEGRPNSHDEGTCLVCRRARGEIEVIEEEDSDGMSINDGVPYSPEGSGTDESSSPASGSPFPVPKEVEEEFERAGIYDPKPDDWDDDEEEEEEGGYATCSGVVDIAFTGETDRRHAQAWGYFNHYGRVRPWDGLIALVRVPLDPLTGAPVPEGRIIFRGYIMGGDHFDGTWRGWTPDPNAVPWEGAVVLSRRA